MNPTSAHRVNPYEILPAATFLEQSCNHIELHAPHHWYSSVGRYTGWWVCLNKGFLVVNND